MDSNFIEIYLVSSGKTLKRYKIPLGEIVIEDIKKRGIETLSGEVVLDDITDYYKFIITAENGYVETPAEEE